jgi:hypothetical protein
MKKLFFLLSIIAMSLFVSAQTKGNIKLYGYKQSVSRGKAPELDENTKTRVSQGSGTNYFLYTVSASRIYPVEAWVEGHHYSLMVETVAETPVEYGDENNIGSPKKVLVPKTTEKVLRLTLLPPVEGKSTGKQAKPLATSNDFVLVYKMNGKFYYSTLKSLSSVENAAMQ